MFNINELSRRLVSSYQKKVSGYDKTQQWQGDNSLEHHILSRAKNIEQCSYRQHSSHSQTSDAESNSEQQIHGHDLIDLDLISGSAYKTKPSSQQGWFASVAFSVIRVLFFPVYLKWWSKQTSPGLAALLLLAYILQVTAVRLYYDCLNLLPIQNFHSQLSSLNNGTLTTTTSINNGRSAECSARGSSEDVTTDVPPSEILMPIAMMVLLSVLHNQIVGTKAFSGKKSSVINNNNKNSSNTNNNNNSSKTPNKNLIKNNNNCDTSSENVSSNSCCEESADSSYMSCGSQDLVDKKSESGYSVTDVSSTSSPKSSPSTSIERNQQRSRNKSTSIVNIVNNNNNNAQENNKNIPDLFSTEVDTEDEVRSMKQLNPLKSDTIQRLQSQSELIKKRNHVMRRRSKESHNTRRTFFEHPPEDTRMSVTPIVTSLQGDDWPMIDSDGNTSCDSYEDSNQAMSKSKNVERSNGASSSTSGLKDSSSYRRPTGNDCHSTREFTVNCALWKNNCWQMVNLSVMDVNSTIIRKVDSVEHSCEYVVLGVVFSLVVAFIPTLYRWQAASQTVISDVSSSEMSVESALIQIDLYGLFKLFLESSLLYSKSLRVRAIIYIAIFERLILSGLYFFLLCVAERTFKQRYLYSKYFSHMTRRDRAQKSQVPFFRLNQVVYLKVWLSVRAYLRRHGPMRSVDTICSYSFILAVVLLFCTSLQLLKDDSGGFAAQLIFWEMIFWCLAIGIFIMRLVILGSSINRKYRCNLSVLITEQINIHLQLERHPQNKEQLMLVNHVLKLAADLLKELEAPYKISGICANSYLYNITRVVVLSAFSALLTEMLGFKLKLDKINLIK